MTFVTEPGARPIALQISSQGTQSSSSGYSRDCKNAPVTSPFCVRKPLLALICNCSCLESLVVVGECVALCSYSGSMYPWRTALAFAFLLPSGFTFQVRIQRMLITSFRENLWLGARASNARAEIKLLTSMAFAWSNCRFSSGASLHSDISTALRFIAVVK